MDYLQAMSIGAAGMAAERARVEVAVMNLAHAHSVLDAAGGYRPLRVVVEGPCFTACMASGQGGPQVRVEPVDRPPRREWDPGHPHADASGFVAYPAVDPSAEMVSMMSALRAYEANVAAMASARTVALKALDIGG